MVHNQGEKKLKGSRSTDKPDIEFGDKSFKMTAINMLKNLLETVDKVDEQMKNFSTEMETGVQCLL